MYMTVEEGNVRAKFQSPARGKADLCLHQQQLYNYCNSIYTIYQQNKLNIIIGHPSVPRNFIDSPLLR